MSPLSTKLLTVLLLLAVMPSSAFTDDTEPGPPELPPPRTTGSLALEAAIAARRSVRNFRPQPLTPAELSQLLWAAQGITEPRRRLRAAPSAGATYPLETYLVTAEGIFKYRPAEHDLQLVKQGDHRAELAQIALGQSMPAAAPATLVFTAINARTTGRYGQRGEMYVHMEAGHAAQNIHLQAVAMGMGSVPIGAFDPQRLAKLIAAGPDETPIYMIPVGYPAERGF